MSVLVGHALPAPPFPTLVDAVGALHGHHLPWLTVWTGGNASPHRGPEIFVRSRRWARALVDAGVRQGDRVALLLPNGLDFVTAFFGAAMAGAAVVPLAWPATLADPGRTLGYLQPLVAVARPRVLVTVPALEARAAELLGVAVRTAPDLSAVVSLPEARPEAPVLLQFTSGSQGRPKGAVISHRALMASAWAMGTRLGFGPDDVGTSWLPLFHDMGLVGALMCPVVFGFPLHLMTPGEFLLHPGNWLKLVSTVRGSIAAAPDFAWAMLARRPRWPEGLDLRSWRHGLDGAEPVHCATLDGFTRRAREVGFPADGLRPVYGLAENTLGVAFADPGDLGRDLAWQGRHIPSVGTPLPGMDVAVDAPPGEQGEIRVRGPALMSGYFEDEVATAAALADGWLRTGDLGVIERGRLHITGREKDLVIRHGRKFHPYDIERVAAVAADSPPNGAAAFSVDSDQGERLVVLVETRQDAPEAGVRAKLLEELGIRVDEVVRMAPGALPRTTSGKLRRGEARAMWP